MQRIPVLFHALFFIYYATAHVAEFVYAIPSERQFELYRFPYAGRWKYLTSWNLSLQLAYFQMALAIDFIPRGWARNRLRCFSDFVFTTLAFPLTVWLKKLSKKVVFVLMCMLEKDLPMLCLSTVVVAFWSIYLYDRELIFPASVDDIIHPLVNHALHTFVLPIAIAEVLLVHHRCPRNRTAALTIFIIHAVYTVWVLWIHYHTGRWVYIFMNKNSRLGYVMMLPVRAFGTFSSFLVGKLLTRIYHTGAK